VAVHKSTEKRMRQNEVRRMRNRHVKTSIKTMVRRVRELRRMKAKQKKSWPG
jgi:small subunit ribosomal protein S20